MTSTLTALRTQCFKDTPCMKGKTVIITGATGGLGFEVAYALAGVQAHVIIAARNAKKGEAAIKTILSQFPKASVRFELVDLASMRSVTDFAQRLIDRATPIDVLINNAGVMGLANRNVTEDGFERQMATNYLSHFLLTAKLLPLMRAQSDARVINVSSILARGGVIRFEDLQSENSYSPNGVYRQTKLAMLMFSLELQRLCALHHIPISAITAHPGYARTDLIANGPGTKILSRRIGEWFKPLLSQSATEGALPIIFAACSTEAQAGGYYGPDGLWEFKGKVSKALIIDRAKTPTALSRLWALSVKLTQAKWPWA